MKPSLKSSVAPLPILLACLPPVMFASVHAPQSPTGGEVCRMDYKAPKWNLLQSGRRADLLVFIFLRPGEALSWTEVFPLRIKGIQLAQVLNEENALVLMRLRVKIFIVD